MDDLDLHRKKRLEMLIASKPYNGDRTAFIEKSKLSKGRISQLLDPDEAFGERAGMRLAESLGLPDLRWFDREHSARQPEWPFTHVTPEQIQSLSPADWLSVENFTLWKLGQPQVLDEKHSLTVQNRPTNPSGEAVQWVHKDDKEQRGQHSSDAEEPAGKRAGGADA